MTYYPGFSGKKSNFWFENPKIEDKYWECDFYFFNLIFKFFQLLLIYYIFSLIFSFNFNYLLIYYRFRKANKPNHFYIVFNHFSDPKHQLLLIKLLVKFLIISQNKQNEIYFNNTIMLCLFVTKSNGMCIL